MHKPRGSKKRREMIQTHLSSAHNQALMLVSTMIVKPEFRSEEIETGESFVSRFVCVVSMQEGLLLFSE